MITELSHGSALTHLLVLEERERGALAGALHDGPIQDLVATRYLADLAAVALRRQAGSEVIDLADPLSRAVAVRDASQEALVAARRVLSSLTARCLDGTGLPDALTAAAAAAGQIGLTVALVVQTEQIDALPPAVAVVAWRLTQALLADLAGRGATVATVEAHRVGDVLRISVTAPLSSGLGAPAVARWVDRAALFGGSIDSEPTGISVLLPLIPDSPLPPTHPSPSNVPLGTEEP